MVVVVVVVPGRAACQRAACCVLRLPSPPLPRLTLQCSNQPSAAVDADMTESPTIGSPQPEGQGPSLIDLGEDLSGLSHFS